jgi:hypothetical protein
MESIVGRAKNIVLMVLEGIDSMPSHALRRNDMLFKTYGIKP